MPEDNPSLSEKEYTSELKLTVTSENKRGQNSENNKTV